ncbi:hypothetical protein PNOK_0001400 [Pyrrhoderma noxium]|uniref:Uncharacterized protein n=1 Tax=Pyrrhoderma noxium TaxID=2282107 RepID=A0A286UTP9_9AGAM|nr:hypothetical protein PNOK_0001400 [Pyrrhoderma noxium]
MQLIDCSFSQWSNAAANNITIIIVDYILMLRVLALWNNNEKLLVSLKTLLFVEAVAKTRRAAKSCTAMAIEVATNLSFCGTFAYRDPHLINLGVIDWMLPAIVGLVFLSLALIKGVKYMKYPAFGGVRLVKILIEDQAFYYAIALSCSVLNIIQFKVRIRNSALTSVFSVLGNPSFQCLLGSRLFFNLKEAALGTSEGSTRHTKSLGELIFVDPELSFTGSSISEQVCF